MSKTILIVEDEPLIAEDLRLIVSSLGYQVHGICTNAAEAQNRIATAELDLVLLDVNIKGAADGIDIAGFIQQNRPELPFIFLTSFFDDHTIARARDTNPVAYLVKPFKDADLKANISLAFSKSALRAPTPTQAQPSTPLELFVRKHNEIVRLQPASILYIRGEDNYSHVHTTDGNRYTTAQTLKAIERSLCHQDLPQQQGRFVRAHKSYVVNLLHISSISGTTLYIGAEGLPIGKSYRKTLFEALTIL